MRVVAEPLAQGGRAARRVRVFQPALERRYGAVVQVAAAHWYLWGDVVATAAYAAALEL